MRMRFVLATGLFLLVLLLAGCGGSGGSGDGPTQEPDSAVPQAQLLSASLGGSVNGTLSAFQGQEVVDPVSVLAELERSELTFTLTGGPEGSSVDQEGTFRYTVPLELTPGTTLPVQIKISHPESNQSIALDETIYVMARTVVGTATLDSAGGEISDEWGEIVVSVPAGAVATQATIDIIRSHDANKNVVVTIEADGEVNDLVEIRLASPELLLLNEPASGPQVALSSAQPKAMSILAASTTNVWNPVVLSPPNYGEFWSHKGKINRLPSSSTIKISLKEKNQFISAVASTLTSFNDLASVQGKIPVLLIHGYFNLPLAVLGESGGLGGGPGTWGRLPEELQSDNRLSVFEFQWITAARFEDVAAGLGMAIQTINKLTGNKVNIVAHSFGGILARTYIQGKATNFPYHDTVASMLTVGTPHAGIFGEDIQRGDIKFLKGQDSTFWFNRCLQISCYQMGEPVWFDEKAKNAFQLSATSYGDFLVGLSNNSDIDKLSSKLPIKVLIGLTSTRWKDGKLDSGDGLIRFAGQRFHAGASDTDQLLTGNVSETVLRFGRVKPGDENPDPAKHEGYRHNSMVWPLDAIPMVKVTSRDHDTFKEIEKWLQNRVAEPVAEDLEFSLSIMVKDEKTGAALNGAHVSIKVNGSEVGSGTTDSNGQANIQNISFFPTQTYTALVYGLSGYRGAEQSLVTRSTTFESPFSFGMVLLRPTTSSPVNPTIAQTPMSGSAGTTFVQWGTGLTPNGTVVLHFRKPDGSEYPTQTVQLDLIGHFETSYTVPADKPAGSYTWWAVDVASGLSSNTVTYEVAAVSGGGSTPTPASRPLNDTGIDWFADGTTNFLTTEPAGYKGQDAAHGRDAKAAASTLVKVGGGKSGFDFTKIAVNGSSLAASATSWSCVRDNATGLTWEVKTDDGGLRDKDWTYTWYNPDPTTNGGSAGVQNGGTCSGGLSCDTAGYVAAANAAGLCGYDEWRMPKMEELLSIVDYGVAYPGPTIDTDYFPNTSSSFFWSGTPCVGGSDNAWPIHFSYGFDSNSHKNQYYAVRLVRSGQ